jgi:hypothetical protein
MAVKFILESKNKKKDERLGRPSFPPLIGWGFSSINKSVNRNKGASFLSTYKEKSATPLAGTTLRAQKRIGVIF